MTTPTLILASSSARRCDLLDSAGIPFELMPSGVEERPRPGEQAEPFARRNALAKARQVAASVRQEPGHCLILGADTIVVCGEDILGKPEDGDEAVEMLRRLSGGTHRVITGVALIESPRGIESDWAVISEVCFRSLREDEIAAYVASGEPMDKAGAYAIQGGAAHMVRSIRGSYTNIVGLPLAEVVEALRARSGA